MEQNRQLQEELLQAWMEMSLYIRGNRILSEFSFNEILICGLLYRRQEAGLPPCTATELCDRTRLLKSQINHILTAMEDRGLISRQRDSGDRRQVLVCLREEAIPGYLQEHEKVLDIVGSVCRALGEQQAGALADMMRRATTIVDEYDLSTPKNISPKENH